MAAGVCELRELGFGEGDVAVTWAREGRLTGPNGIWTLQAKGRELPSTLLPLDQVTRWPALLSLPEAKTP